MANESANIGANFSQYQGNAGLGGLDIGVINIDTKPIEDLGRYTMIARKAAQEQQQKDIEAQAAKLADLTAYDLTTAIPKEREIIQKEYDNLYNYVKENPTVLDYKNNPQGWLEYNKKKNDFANILKPAKMSSILYIARQNEIAATKDPELKALMEKNLAKEVASKDIKNPLKATQQFDLSPANIPAPQIKVFDVNIVGDDENAKREFAMVDMKDINSKAAQITLGLNSAVLDETSADFLSKSPEEQDALREQYITQKAGDKLITLDQAEQYNTVLAQYKNENGELDVTAIATKNPILAGVMKSFDDYNNYVNNIREQIKAGAYKDKLGKVLQFGAGGLSEYDYQPISYTDGITPEELIKVQMLAKAKPDSYKTTIQETDNKLQQDQLRQKTINDAENRAIERAKLAQTKREWETGMNASENLRNSAWKFGQDVIAKLNQVKDQASTISGKQFEKLDNEILMALGSEQPEVRDAEGKIIKEAGFYPLQVKPGNLIRVVGDNVYVYNKEGEFAANPIASTSLANIATNRLIREMKASSGKEINLFSGVDADKAPVSITDTKTKTSSGSSSSSSGAKQISQSDIPAKAAAAGYSVKEYTDLLKQKGVKIIK